MKYTVRHTSSNKITVKVRRGKVYVYAPIWMGDDCVAELLKPKRSEIEKIQNKQIAQEEGTEAYAKLTKKELSDLTKQAKRLLPQRVAYFAKIIGVDYGKITVRHQRTRWGSCSSKGNLNFNCLLMLTEPEIVDAIVVHELCHRKYMNHSKAFYEEIIRVLPDYKARMLWLKKRGGAIIRMLPDEEPKAEKEL